MSEATTTILDHIEGISVPGDVFVKPANEYWALVWLNQGMEFLYHQASRCDQTVLKQIPPDSYFETFGNSPFFDAVPKALLTASFHWYAMSAYQYALIVGAIAHRQDNARPIPPHYVRQVMPDVLAFRDKVAAHFAWAKNHDKDNAAERLASILPQLGFIGSSFHMPPYTVAVTEGEKHSTSESLVPWSICRVHERLRERYWPIKPSAHDGSADLGSNENAG